MEIQPFATEESIRQGGILQNLKHINEFRIDYICCSEEEDGISDKLPTTRLGIQVNKTDELDNYLKDFAASLDYDGDFYELSDRQASNYHDLLRGRTL